MTDRVGQQIGNYRLNLLLGEGGFAEVYLGEHLYLGSQAAIKLLHTHVAQSDIAQFQQEGRMLAKLIHPNIVRVLDFGIDDRTPYLVMDYAPGGTLRTRHPKGTRVPLSTVVQYVKQIGQALQYAHDQKFIHRDIKPENMLIGRDGTILLSDFGIALIAQSSRSQSTKDMVGTVAYMAPEQIAAHPRTASDQYSLGIVMYEWLSGERPFRGSLTEIAIKQSITPPPSLVEQLPSLPPAVEQVIFAALAKKSEDRFASIRSFVTALEQASTIEPPPRRPIKQSPPHAEERAKDSPGKIVLKWGGIFGTGLMVWWLIYYYLLQVPLIRYLNQQLHYSSMLHVLGYLINAAVGGIACFCLGIVVSSKSGKVSTGVLACLLAVACDCFVAQIVAFISALHYSYIDGFLQYLPTNVIINILFCLVLATGPGTLGGLVGSSTAKKQYPAI